MPRSYPSGEVEGHGVGPELPLDWKGWYGDWWPRHASEKAVGLDADPDMAMVRKGGFIVNKNIEPPL